MIAARILWRAVPAWAKWAALGALVLFGAFYAGKWTEATQTAADVADGRIENIEGAEAEENDIESKSDDDLRGILERVLGNPAD